MKKRILSVLLALAMVFTLVPVTVFAAPTYQVVTVDKTTVQAGETVNVKVTLPEGIETAGSFTVNLKFDTALFEVVSVDVPTTLNATTKSGKSIVVPVVYGEADDANNSGELTANAAYTNNTIQVAGVTVIDATLKAKASGSAAFSFTTFEITRSESGSTVKLVQVSDLETPPSVTIPKAPITSVNIADLDDPVKGGTPDTNVTVTPSGLVADVNWFDDATQVTGNFAANTAYTVKIKLTASGGDNFAETVTAGDYTVTRNSETELLLTKTFPKTNDKDTPVCVAPTGVTATFGSALSTITLTNPTGNTAGEWYWMDDAQKVGNVKDNPHTYKAKFVPNDTANFSTVENIDVTVTATQVVLGAGYPIMNPIEEYYTGSAIEPTPTIKTDNYGDELVLNQDYKITKYEDNTNVGTGKIFIEPLANGNYSFTAGSYTFTIKAGTSSISITGDPSKTYDGNVVTDPAVSTSGSTGAVTYTYYTDAACTTKTTTASGAASDGAAPKNAGDYWVKATLAADSNHSSATSAAKKFTISQKALTNDMIILGTQTTYDGTAHGPVYSVKDSATVLNKGTDYTETSGYSPVTNVGNTTLKISGAGNYKGTAQKDWSLVAKDVTITPDAKSKTYGTADPELTYTTSIDGEVALKNKFVAAKSGALSYTGMNVGSYPIGLGTLKAGNNFKLTLDTTPVYLTITPKNVADAEVTATISNQTTIKDVGEFVDPVIKGVKGEDLTGTLTYAYGSETGKTHAEVVTMLKGKNVNDVVTLTYTFTPPAGNYTGTKIDSFKVTVKDIEFLVGTAPATVANTLTVRANPTYGDDWSDIVKIKDGVTITARVGTATDTDQSHFTLRPTGKPNAGNNQTYELVYNGTINGTNYANVVVVSGTVNVAKKDVTITGLTASNKEYDGNTTATPAGTAVINGKVGSDDVAVTTGTAAFADKNVGTGKTVTFTGYSLSGTTAGNYNLKAQPASVTANITAKKVTVTGITATNRPYAKDNLEVALTGGTVSGVVSGDTVTIDLTNAKGTMTDANAGNGKAVTVTGVALGGANKGNYKLKEQPTGVTVDITKAAALTLADIPVSQKYTTTTGAKAIGTVMPADAGTLTYAPSTASKTGSVTIDSWAVDSTGKVTYTLSGGAAGDTVTLPVIIKSTNYADATVNVVITLTAKENQAALTLTGGETVVYGQTLKLGTSGGSGDGAVTYAVTNGTGEATINATTGELTPVKVGIVKVKATKAGNADYNAITSAEVEITITRATPTGAPKYTAITTSGKTLADAGLTTTGSNLTPAGGKIEWVDNAGHVLPDTTTVEANKEYKWRYTPVTTDAVNYTTLTGTIVLYRASTGIVIYSPCYTIKASAGANGSISPAGWCSVVENGNQTFTFTPDKGYTVAKVLVDGKSVGAVKSYTFKDVTKDHTIEVIFMKSNGNPATGVFVMP